MKRNGEWEVINFEGVNEISLPLVASQSNLTERVHSFGL